MVIPFTYVLLNWDATFGLAGIVHVLMDMELKPYDVEDLLSLASTFQ